MLIEKRTDPTPVRKDPELSPHEQTAKRKAVEKYIYSMNARMSTLFACNRIRKNS